MRNARLSCMRHASPTYEPILCRNITKDAFVDTLMDLFIEQQEVNELDRF